MDNIIHISTICDDGYAVPASVMLTSAKMHKHPQNKYCVHVLCNNVSPFHKRKFEELSAPDFNIRLIDCDAAKYDSMKMPFNITASTMIKCDIAELLPDVEKLLLLDGDMLVKKDLKELYDTDLSGKIVAATNDMVGMADMKLHELVGVERYFNAGLMLLNLDLMRQERIGEKIFECKRNAPDTWTLGEQDPFNKICNGRDVVLPLSWNVELALLRTLKHSIDDINSFYGTSYSSYTEMEDDAGILHFCNYKPWKNRLLTDAPLWQKYHDVSPYGDTTLAHEPDYPKTEKKTGTTIKLFGIPFLSHYENEFRKDCKLFGLFRLYKIKKRKNYRKFYLLGFIPLIEYTWNTEIVI